MNKATEPPLPATVKVRLALEILAGYAVARWTVRRRDLPSTLEALRGSRSGRARVRGTTLADRRRLARAVVRTLAPLPTDTRCLMRSLVLTRLLARRGIDSQLVIAVQPGESFAAHSWVERDGEILLDPGTEQFARLVTL
jgi:hypothetical protein